MQVAIYIAGYKLDLFDDEPIQFVGKVTDLNDLSKVFMDFTQSFSIPASRLNNFVFQHYYDSDIDGAFNANIRIPAVIELDTLPLRSGKVQLEEVKMKDKEPESYKITFYSEVKNLQDRFGDDKLASLTGSTITTLDHAFSRLNVYEGAFRPTFKNGDLIYPLITVDKLFRIGTNQNTETESDIYTDAGAIKYTNLKPAVRAIKLIEGIEEKYGVSFSRDFFGRAAFQDLFLWLSNEAGPIKATGMPKLVNFTSQTVSTGTTSTLNLTTDTLTFTQNSGTTIVDTYDIFLEVTPQTNDVQYKVSMEINGVADAVKLEGEDVIGPRVISFTPPRNTPDNRTYNIRFFVQPNAQMFFSTKLTIRKRRLPISGAPAQTFYFSYGYSPVEEANGVVNIAKQMPDLKIKDFFGSIMKMFNLVIRPTSQTSFYVNTLNDFYAGGDTFDLTRYTDIKDITIARPILNKEIHFKYNKTENILGEKFRDSFGGGDTGYGDLKATYPIDSGETLKIELPFDNMLFERLDSKTPTTTGSTLSNIMVGSTVNKELAPNNSKPILFYNNGLVDLDKAIKFETAPNNIADVLRVYQISNENDIYPEQITDTINFNTEVSPWLYQEVSNSLYKNYWDKYIKNVYDLKQRKYTYKAWLPVNIINYLSLDDKLIINDRQYRINDFKVNLVTGESNFTLCNNLFDEKVKTTVEGIDVTSILSTAGIRHYDIIIDTDTTWSVSKSGIDTSWVTFSQESGVGKTRVTIRINHNTSPLGNTNPRTMNLNFTTNGNTYTTVITQEGIIFE